MKIWLQSAAAVGKDPLWGPYEKALMKHAQAVARPGTTVELHGVDVMSTGIGNTRYFEFLNTNQIINNGIKADRAGYDAFAVSCMADPGAPELKGVVDMPLVFSLETSAHLACLLSPKFALLGYNAIALKRMTEKIKQYGLGERQVPGGHFELSLTALQGGFKDPEPVIKLAKSAAKKAAEQGADMLILSCGCLNMILVTNGIKELDGLPVIDSVGTVVKMAEFLVDFKKMGMERVNRGLYARVAKNELAAVRKLYKVE